MSGAALLRRGADRISGYTDRRPHGIDVAGLLDWARSLAGQLDDPSNDVGSPSAPKFCGT
ncbi:MAG: hypothetical protein ACYCV4_10680 [Dermatophilaceae bacterium]